MHTLQKFRFTIQSVLIQAVSVVLIASRVLADWKVCLSSYCNIKYYSMNNGRFAVSLHILTLLAFKQGEWLSSEYIAGSININPVLVRKEISNLREAGLVESREGKNGGTTLAKSPSKILLSDVYNAVRQEALLGRSRNDPNPDCVIGSQINGQLDELYSEVEDALIQRLGKKTLAAFYKQFR